MVDECNFNYVRHAAILLSCSDKGGGVMVSGSEQYVGRGGVGGVKLDMVSRLASQADKDEND